MVSSGNVKAIRVSLNRPNLYYEVVQKPAGRPNATARLVDEIKSLDGQSVIVYCMKRVETEQVAGDLRAAGISAGFYHAGMESERDERQAQFMSGETQVIVATIAFGMGIDKPDVRMVAHWDLPKSIEAYYQETGRAGRDGRPARCLLLYSRGAIGDQQWFARQHDEASVRAHALANVDRIARLCETTGCRRKMMLEYFGESPPTGCDGCDNCKADWEEVDVTQVWELLATTIMLTGERYGYNYIVDLVRGIDSDARVKTNSHDELPTFGSLRRHAKNELLDVLRRLMDNGHLERYGEHGSIRLTQLGRRKLQAKEKVTVRRRTDDQEPKEGKAPTSTQSPAPEQAVADYDPRLFESLRELRLTIAREIGKPAFVVFPDTTLKRMASAAPTTLGEMSQISGVGPAKLADYGERFVAVVMAHLGKNGANATSIPRKFEELGSNEVSDGCPALYEELKELQVRVLRNAGVTSAGLSNETLRKIAARLPATQSQLEDILGVGPVRSAVYTERFLEAIASHSGNCRRCKPDSRKAPAPRSAKPTATVGSGSSENALDATDLLRNVTETIDATGGIYELHWIASILLGIPLEVLAVKGHTQLRTFGIEKARSHKDLRRALWQLIDLGFFARQRGASGVLEVTELCRKVIDSGEPIWLPKLPA